MGLFFRPFCSRIICAALAFFSLVSVQLYVLDIWYAYHLIENHRTTKGVYPTNNSVPTLSIHFSLSAELVLFSAVSAFVSLCILYLWVLHTSKFKKTEKKKITIQTTWFFVCFFDVRVCSGSGYIINNRCKESRGMEWIWYNIDYAMTKGSLQPDFYRIESIRKAFI